ncbi:MAG: CBS domain-containing protein [Chloroflexi bacterium]|nr:CBS domain-containing protein [Chloroflexota bacterium]
MEENRTDRKLVRDLMKVGVVTCLPDTPLADLVGVFLEGDVEAVAVLNTDRHCLGIVTQDDLLEAYIAGDYAGLQAGDLLREEIPRVPPDIPLEAAAQIMRDRHVRVVYQMHHAGGWEYPAAVLTYRHFLRHMAAQSGLDDLSDLGLQAKRELPLDSFIRRRDTARRKASGPDKMEDG